jgi:hypothetical protein
MHVLLQDSLQHFAQHVLACECYCVLSLLVVFLILGLVLLRDFFLAFRKIGLLVVFEPAVV